VLGKALAAGLFLALIGGATLFLGFLYHDLAWNKFLPSIVWVTFSGVGLFAWFSALQMLLPSSKAANLFTTILVFPLLMMGGSFFPMEALPDWLATIGRMSPNGFVVDRLSGELTTSGSWTFDTLAWTVVAAMTLSGLLVCSWRLDSGFASK
ncbi:MAG TPA: ABC transporter permease, partial [Woeseiaceae bacterium]|nr:ABC transporter permease [Woeseiaceae bacterium]